MFSTFRLPTRASSVTGTERLSVTVWFFASTVMFFGVLPSTVGRLFVCVRSIQSA